MTQFKIDFLNQYLSAHRISKNRLSHLIKQQILYLLNSKSSERVVEEIAYLEDADNTQTKIESKFKGPLLKDFWKKHYYSSRFIGQNLLNEWKMNSKTSRKFEQMALEVSRPYVHNRFPSDSDKLKDLNSFCADLAKEFIEGYVKRVDSKKLTGEWVIFKRHEHKNYYLTLGFHGENDKEILDRIKLCEKEFPFLF